MTGIMRRQYFETVAVLIAVVALAGCSGGTAGTPTSGMSTTSSSQPVRSVDAPADGNTHAEGQSGRVGIFLSATPDSKLPVTTEHLWANILKIELIDIQEKPVTVYDTQDGESVDLTTLYDPSGERFALVASPAIPAGKAYIRARITFARSFSFFAANSPTGQMIPLDDTLAHDDKENPILSFPLTRPRDLGSGRENLVINFDLAKMQIRDGRIIPALREGDQNGLEDLSRQIPTTFVGTVQELTEKDPPSSKAGEANTQPASALDKGTAPTTPSASTPDKGTIPIATPTPVATTQSDSNTVLTSASSATKSQTTSTATSSESKSHGVSGDATKSDTVGPGHLFNLALGTNRSIMIQTGEATVYDTDGATPNPTLAVGKKAMIRGILDPTTKRLFAERVTVLSGDIPSAENTTLHGTVASIDAKNNLLIVNATQTEGILPTFAAVTVQMIPDAVYRSRGGILLTADEFAATLTAQPGATVAVSGVYEPVTGTLRGKTARLEETTTATAHEAEVTGVGQNIDEHTGTFTLSALTLWQGIAARSEGNGVPIITTAATAYADEKGMYLATVNFYRALKDGQHSVQATGLYADGKLTATRLELLPLDSKPADTKAETKSTVSAPAKEDAKPEDKPKSAPVEKNDSPKLPAPSGPITQ